MKPSFDWALLYLNHENVEMNVLFLRMGLLLGFGAVFLQIAVFLQPLLPKQYQIAPVCETISQTLLQSNYYQIKSAQLQSNQHLNHQQYNHQQDEKTALHEHAHHSSGHDRHEAPQQVAEQSFIEHQVQQASISAGHDHHDPNHQCQYCTVYGNLVLPPVLEVKEVLVKIQVRLIAFQQAYLHVWFALQRLFLLPQGRAPPLFA